METSSRSQRRSILVGVCIAGLVLTITALKLATSNSTSGVSLVLTGFERLGPFAKSSYAEFQLINNTTNTIFYPLLRDSVFRTFRIPATLYRENTSTGWTSVRWESGQVSVMHPLHAGQKVSLRVPVDDEASPKRIAVMCQGIEVRRSAFSNRLRQWLAPVGKALNVEITPPGLLLLIDQQVWCNEVIAPPKTNQPPISE